MRRWGSASRSRANAEIHAYLGHELSKTLDAGHRRGSGSIGASPHTHEGLCEKLLKWCHALRVL